MSSIVPLPSYLANTNLNPALNIFYNETWSQLCSWSPTPFPTCNQTFTWHLLALMSKELSVNELNGVSICQFHIGFAGVELIRTRALTGCGWSSPRRGRLSSSKWRWRRRLWWPRTKTTTSSISLASTKHWKVKTRDIKIRYHLLPSPSYTELSPQSDISNERN